MFAIRSRLCGSPGMVSDMDSEPCTDLARHHGNCTLGTGQSLETGEYLVPGAVSLSSASAGQLAGPAPCPYRRAHPATEHRSELRTRMTSIDC
ncbi:hypothetical protein SGLAU_32720 (plasmid) [Streptomyces glaucescens]|uniref:Uncharacterized protein n=1 Tax=Streptomyces glaucescens TaxID=1907 RepID=A0A089Z9P4_STRGA|nr:hypothetical protein SGLAU_32720 [Streptomyces glaucescens]